MHKLTMEHNIYVAKSTEELILNEQYFFVQTFVNTDLVICNKFLQTRPRTFR